MKTNILLLIAAGSLILAGGCTTHHAVSETNASEETASGQPPEPTEHYSRTKDTYTVRVLCDIRPPNDVRLMTDFYQEARPLKRPGRHKDSTVVELLIHPLETPRIVPQPYPGKEIPQSLRIYTNRTLAFNYSDQMQKEVRQIVGDAKTDVEAIERILAWIAKETRVDNTIPEFGFFHVKDNQIVWDRHLGSPEEEQRLLESNFFGDSMFKKRIHGTCSSIATLRATMFRAAGIPARLIQTLPLFNHYPSDPQRPLDRMRRREFTRGYEWGPEGGGANHMYNEVFIANQWVRVDNEVGTGPFVGDKLFVKVYSAADWNNLIPARSAEDFEPQNRDFFTLEVSDTEPKHAAAQAATFELALDQEALMVESLPGGRFRAVVTIRNKGQAPSPGFAVWFYAGNPQASGRRIAAHHAGPIVPRGTWREGTHPFVLNQGESRVFVVLDPENQLKRAKNTPWEASQSVGGVHAKPKQTASDAAEFELVFEEALVLPLPDGRLRAVMAIRNKGQAPIPEFPVWFYVGDPQAGGRIISRNGAGPIEPGGIFREGSAPFVPQQGESRVFAVLDPENKLNQANPKLISVGREIPASKAEPGAASASTSTFNVLIAQDALTMEPLPDGQWKAGVLIRNTGTAPSPAMRVVFYAGHPRKNGRLLSINQAGPILPKDPWKEVTRFAFKENETEVFAVVDPDNVLQRPAESKDLILKAVAEGKAAASEDAKRNTNPQEN